MILDFLYTSAKLKKIPRQGWIEKLAINHPESVADHTYSMAIMGMIFSDMKNYDTGKILKIVLLHDLVESITGDMTPEQISKDEKIDLENKTIKIILKDLPKLLQKQYNVLWDEYQSNKSIEARFVHQIDKLEMALQAKIYRDEGSDDKKTDIFFNSAKNSITDPNLLEIFKEISRR
ncbi:MAG: HD domain-containing protein [Nitrosarchaeum sp.]